MRRLNACFTSGIDQIERVEMCTGMCMCVHVHMSIYV